MGDTPQDDDDVRSEDVTQRVSAAGESGVTEGVTTRLEPGAGDSEGPTTRLGDGASAATSPASAIGWLDPGENVLPGLGYTVVRTLQPHETRMPGVYHCTDASGEEVMVKVAATQYPPEPEVWSCLTEFDHPHVIRTYQTVEVSGLFVEIQQYCNGGALKDRVGLCDEAWITRVFLPHVVEGLQFLHERGIVHRDIKPGNIYVKGTPGGTETLVLGDLDISSTLDLTATSRETSRMDGTWVYAAPETFPLAFGMEVSRAADYYSVGVSIVELLVGTTSLHAADARLRNLFNFYLRGNRMEIPESISDRMRTLVQGLLILDRRDRWCDEHVRRWLEDANTKDDLEAIVRDSRAKFRGVGAGDADPFNRFDIKATTFSELAEQMLRKQKEAALCLNDPVLVGWVAGRDNELAGRIQDDANTYRATPALMVMAAALNLDPNVRFQVPRAGSAASAYEWADEVLAAREAGADVSELVSDEAAEMLAVWLERRGGADVDLALKVRTLVSEFENLSVRLLALLWLAQPDRPYRVAKGLGAVLPEEVATLTYGDPKSWSEGIPEQYESSFARWRDGYLRAWMRARGLDDQVRMCDEATSALAKHPYAAFETCLRQLNPELPDVQIVVDAGEASAIISTQYGDVGMGRIRYRTTGPGVPFGTLSLKGARKGLKLVSHVLSARDAAVEIKLESKNDVPVLITHGCELSFEGAFSCAAQLPLSLSYRVDYPTRRTVQRVGLGALVGGAALGLPRLIAAAVSGNAGPVPATELNAEMIWELTREMAMPGFGYAMGLAALVWSGYLSYRLWLRAMATSER